VTGSRVDAAVYRAGRETTEVPLEFEPHGSRFLVFRRPLPSRWVESATPALKMEGGKWTVAPGAAVELRGNDGKTVRPPVRRLPGPQTIGGPWRVSFEPGRGAPAEVTLADLQSWTEHPDPGVKFFSGVATYRTSFRMAELPAAGAMAVLDLGSVGDLAEVTINDRPVGILWQPPLRADVTAHLRVGENRLEVRVANRWINRLIGDEQIPTDLTYQKPGTNKFTDGRLEQLPPWLYDRSRLGEKRRVSFATWKHYSADSPLVPAGLLGPVRLEWRGVVDP
jgi:hypothetical protein